MKRKKKPRRCWYFITVWDCVLCAYSHEIRERRYGRRPKSYDERHRVFEQACSDHFM